MEGTNIKKILLIVLLVLPVSLAVLFYFRGFIRDVILTPLVYLSWLAGQVLTSIDQKYIWFAFVILLGFLMARSFRLHGSGSTGGDYMEPRSAERGRIRFWMVQLSSMDPRGAGYLKEHSTVELRNLILDVFSQNERISHRQMEQQLSSGERKAPAEIKALFDTKSNIYSPKFSSWLEHLKYSWQKLVIQRHKEKPANQEEQIDTIIQYLIEEMEGRHDRWNF